MPTQAEYESAVAAMIASSAWINGSESEREALAESLHQTWGGIWEQVGSWWAELWDNFKDWLIPPKNSQKSIGQWFSEWWAAMFPPSLGVPWSIPPTGGPD